MPDFLLNLELICERGRSLRSVRRERRMVLRFGQPVRPSGTCLKGFGKLLFPEKTFSVANAVLLLDCELLYPG
jgi:hypothetical protein